MRGVQAQLLAYAAAFRRDCPLGVATLFAQQTQGPRAADWSFAAAGLRRTQTPHHGAPTGGSWSTVPAPIPNCGLVRTKVDRGMVFAQGRTGYPPVERLQASVAIRRATHGDDKSRGDRT